MSEQNPFETAAPDAASDATPARRRNAVGVAALAVGVIGVLLGAVSTFAPIGAILQGDYALVGLLSAVSLTVAVVLGLTATILGIAGLAARDRPRAAAGVGLGLGAAHLISAVLGVTYSLVLSSLA
ncbi:hypothetical protein [Agromyces atrinae]|uniref:Uncharacterized protein n=1 Tax=Agromyces atrinae TaxID=592376 RepID=A0A4Q2M6X2_9MICO|nr:hypothetical protein [Agromyces atrinae]NYD68170.1 hypothetical protein [Agromyces atrinae]RXZ87688.1 hypothetical protein ESP50_00320 [Agromyces atrinae]